MYICENCGYRFDEPMEYPLNRPRCGESYTTEYGSVCPRCHRTSYDKAECCDICGELFLATELTDGVCLGCEDEVEEAGSPYSGISSMSGVLAVIGGMI